MRAGAARHWLYLGLVLALAAMAYFPTLEYGFVWDDLPLIVENEIFTAPDGLQQIFFRNFWDVGGRNDSFRHFYRPVVTLSYWLNTFWGGLQPMAFHAVNVALHLACTALVFPLLLRLLGRPDLAFLGAAYFALHPTHVENVAWVSGRTDLLAAFFGLLALHAWLRYDEGRPAWLAAASVSYFLALLSKEVALLFPVAWLLFPLRDAQGLLQWDARRRWGLAAAGLALALYAALRWNVLGVVASNVTYPGAATFLPALGWVLFSYLKLALTGLALDPHYSDVQFSHMQGATAMWGWVLLLLLPGLALLGLRGAAVRARGLALAILFLLPVLSLGSFGDVLYADRFLYLPSLGLGALLAAGLGAALRRLSPGGRETGHLVLGGCLALALLLQTGRASRVWADNIRLFERASQSSPDSVLIWNNLCLSYTYEGRYKEAEWAGRRALALQPGHGFANHNVGVALRRQGRPEDALPYLIAAQRVEPLDSLYTYNLAEALSALGRLEEAERWYRRTLELKPSNQEARHNLGYLLLTQGRLAAARPLLEVSAAQARRPAPAYNSLGLLAVKERRWSDARAHFEKAVALDPTLASARANLARLDKEGR